jgi:hypothetical protein
MKPGLSRKDYSAYIRSEAWALKKAQFRRSKLCKRRCRACGRRGVPLDIHHRTYWRLGQEWLHDLIELCRECHKRGHELGRAEGNDAKKVNRFMHKILQKQNPARFCRKRVRRKNPSGLNGYKRRQLAKKLRQLIRTSAFEGSTAVQAYKQYSLWLLNPRARQCRNH